MLSEHSSKVADDFRSRPSVQGCSGLEHHTAPARVGVERDGKVVKSETLDHALDQGSVHGAYNGPDTTNA